jgi:hypothetical protein
MSVNVVAHDPSAPLRGHLPFAESAKRMSRSSWHFAGIARRLTATRAALVESGDATTVRKYYFLSS